MTHRLSCPMEGCHATIEADSADEVMAAAEAHAADAHPDLVLDEATVSSLRDAIETV